MSGTVSIRWLDEPEEKDYQAAQSFLSMVLAPSSLSEVIAALHAAPHGRWAAKDILRAAGLPPLRPKGERRGGREAQGDQGSSATDTTASAAYGVEEDVLVRQVALVESSASPEYREAGHDVIDLRGRSLVPHPRHTGSPAL